MTEKLILSLQFIETKLGAVFMELWIHTMTVTGVQKRCSSYGRFRSYTAVSQKLYWSYWEYTWLDAEYFQHVLYCRYVQLNVYKVTASPHWPQQPMQCFHTARMPCLGSTHK